MRHNFIDKKTPKPQPDTTLPDHPVRTELPKSAGQWGGRSPAEPGKKAVRAPCKNETGTTERGRGSPSTPAPLMSGSGTDRPRDKKRNEVTRGFFQSRPAIETFVVFGCSRTRVPFCHCSADDGNPYVLPMHSGLLGRSSGLLFNEVVQKDEFLEFFEFFSSLCETKVNDIIPTHLREHEI